MRAMSKAGRPSSTNRISQGGSHGEPSSDIVGFRGEFSEKKPNCRLPSWPDRAQLMCPRRFLFYTEKRMMDPVKIAMTLGCNHFS